LFLSRARCRRAPPARARLELASRQAQATPRREAKKKEAPALAWCPHAGLVPDWCGTGAGLVRDWCRALLGAGLVAAAAEHRTGEHQDHQTGEAALHVAVDATPLLRGLRGRRSTWVAVAALVLHLAIGTGETVELIL